MSRFVKAVSAACVAAVLVMGSAASAQTGRISSKESDLAAAGFQARTADNADRQAMLASLPAKKILLRSYNGVSHYVYADPKGCNCIYVGDAAAYQAYTQARQQQAAADAQEWTAQSYADARWNWGAWGGFGPGFVWGPAW